MAFALYAFLFNPFGQTHGIQLFPFDLQTYDKGPLRNLSKDPLSFCTENFLFFSRTCAVRRLFILHFFDLQPAVPLQSFGVFLDGVPEIGFLDLSDTNQCNTDHQ